MGEAHRHVPLDGGPWKLAMGLRRLDLSEWLEVDDLRDAELAYKASLLSSARDDVVAILDGSRPAAEELSGLVVTHLFEHEQRSVELDDSLHPIEAASRVVQEDLCVLERTDGAWRLTAACVCFPSRWRLADKLGATVAEIHGPVPGFERDLGRQTSTFFERLTVERPVWRCNWTVLDTPELHLPSPAARARATGSFDPGSLWFRVERQTLRRLPATGAIVFTIRTYVTSLRQLVTSDAQAARSLRDTLGNVPADVTTYKGWTALLAPTISWLGDVTANSPGAASSGTRSSR
jgi:dimethylamine monooxygenase subunit A